MGVEESGEAAKRSQVWALPPGPPRLRCGGHPNGGGLRRRLTVTEEQYPPPRRAPRRRLGARLALRKERGRAPSLTDGLCFPGICVNLQHATRALGYIAQEAPNRLHPAPHSQSFAWRELSGTSSSSPWGSRQKEGGFRAVRPRPGRGVFAVARHPCPARQPPLPFSPHHGGG